MFMANPESQINSNRVMYTPSVFARTSLNHLKEIGSHSGSNVIFKKNDNMNAYMFLFANSGMGSLYLEGSEHKINAGDCAFFNCKKGYQFKGANSNVNLSWIIFYGPAMTNIYENFLERGGCTIFHPDNIYSFEDTWHMLFEATTSSEHIREMKINDGLSHLLMLIMKESCHPVVAEKPQGNKIDIVPVKEYLDEHYSEKITLNTLGDFFYANPTYLNRTFKAQYGISIMNYLKHIRMAKAKQMLRYTSTKIEEIGILCGLGELSYFSRTFKKEEGVSPRSFRERHA